MENGPVQDNIVQDLLSTLPLLHRTVRRELMKDALSRLEVEIFPPHIEVLKTLIDHGTMKMSQIGETLHLTRPQVTPLVDKLVGLDLVERETDPNDRRNILVTLTSEGRKTLDSFHGVVRDSIRVSISSLSDEDLSELSTCLKTIKVILSKLA